MKKKITWIVCAVMILCSMPGIAYAAEPEGVTGEDAVQPEGSDKGSGPSEETAQIIASFLEYDISDAMAYEHLTVEKGTALEELGLPDEIPVVLEGTEEEAVMPVKWKCVDDGFGGSDYVPEHENDAAAYTFVMEIEEGYELSRSLQEAVDSGGTLPWIEVRYEEQEASEAVRTAAPEAMSSETGLEETALPESDDNGVLWYSTHNTSGGYPKNSFDIKKSGGNQVSTTYANNGYKVLIGKDAIAGSDSSDRSHMVTAKNGKVQELQGLQVQPRLAFTADQAYVRVTYRIYNPADTAQEVNMAVYADIQIGSNDSAPIRANSTGIAMSNDTDQFNLYCRNTYGTTAADTLWFGKYNDYEKLWKDIRDSGAQSSEGKYEKDADGKITGYSNADSGMALSWQGHALAPKAYKDFSFLMSVGQPVDPPQIDMETELTLDYATDAIGVEALVTDADDRTYQIYHSLDDGGEQVLDASVGGTAHGTGPIDASGVQQTVTGSIAVPAEWEENSVHKLEVWVKNDKYAMSDVKVVYVIKKEKGEGPGSGDEIVEARQYTITFAPGDGAAGTPPAPITAYEMTEVTLPLNTFTKEGIRFGGWSDGTRTYGAGAAYKMPSKDTELAAVFPVIDITVKPEDAEKYVGEALPKGKESLEEVIAGTSALTGGDTLANLGTPEYGYGEVTKDSPKGEYPITLTIKNQSPQYNITCKDGKLTVLQDDPAKDVNYTVAGTKGKDGWYRSPITIAPAGDYDKLKAGSGTADSITIDGEAKEVDIQLVKSSTGRITSVKKDSFKSDPKAPEVVDLQGNPTEWQTEEAEISFSLKDDLSGLAASSVKISKGSEEITFTEKGGVYTFRTSGSAKYVVYAEDKAGNELNEEILVNKIQTDGPAPPSEEEINDKITIGGDPDNEDGKPADPDGWYTDNDIVINLENPVPAPGDIKKEYHYKIWKEGDDPDSAREETVGNGNQPSIKEDGIWHVEIWLEDEAGNISPSVTKTIMVDSTAPNADSREDHLVLRNGGTSGAGISLDDATSGIDPGTIRIQDPGMAAVAAQIREKDGTYTCSFQVSTGGIYQLSCKDKAGNTLRFEITVTALNASVNCTGGIQADSDRDKLLEAVDLSGYNSGETVDLLLNLGPLQAAQLDARQNQAFQSLAGSEADIYYFDASMTRSVQNHDGQMEEAISKLDNPIRIKLAIPQEIRGNYEYRLYREHDGQFGKLPVNLEDDRESLTFETDGFSTYALSYTEVKEQARPVVKKTDAPPTGDGANIALFIICTGLMLILILRISYLKIKKFS